MDDISEQEARPGSGTNHARPRSFWHKGRATPLLSPLGKVPTIALDRQPYKIRIMELHGEGPDLLIGQQHSIVIHAHHHPDSPFQLDQGAKGDPVCQKFLLW